VKAIITLSFELDADFLLAMATHRGVLPDAIAREIFADAECRVFDVVKWMDGIDTMSVRSTVTVVDAEVTP